MKLLKPNAFNRFLYRVAGFSLTKSKWFQKFVVWVQWLFPRLFISYVLWNFPLISAVVAIALVWWFVSEDFPRPWE